MARGAGVSKNDRMKWLEQHRKGDRIDSIARQSGRDPSVVGKNIKTAEREEERYAARIAVYQDSIRGHNTAMTAALRRLRDRLSFQFPHRVTASLSHTEGGGDQPGDFLFEDDLANFRVRQLVVEGEHGLENELIREHLRDRVTLWRDYDKWLGDHARYLWEAWRFGEKASRRFQKESGLKPIEGDGFSASCINQLCGVAFGMDKEPSQSVESRLRVDGSSLQFEGVRIVHSPEDPKLQRAKSAFVSVAAELKQRDEARQIAQEVIHLPEREKKLRREFDVIAVMGLIVDTCEACKSFIK